MDFNATHEHQDGIDIVCIFGDVRPDTIGPLQTLIERILPACEKLIIEIPSERDFTTAGITLLTEILHAFEGRGGKLNIVCTDEFHIENLEICNLTPKFCKVSPSIPEAINAFK